MIDKEIVALYVRVSTQEQAREGYSIEEQKDKLIKYAEAHGWIIYNTYVDAGYSGGSLERPSIKRLLDDADGNKFTKVVVYKLDRISRSQKDTLFLIEDVFIPNGVDFVSMSENFDTSTPFGKFMIGILSTFAQLERETIKERTRLGKEGRAKSGLWGGGGRVPIGYRYDNNDNLTIDPYEATIVKRIYKEYTEDLKTIREISRQLRQEKLRSSYGPFPKTTVFNILHHKVYAGYIMYNGKDYAGIHEPIISLETWEKAQERLKYYQKEDKNNLNFYKKASIITSMVVCPYCGDIMILKYDKVGGKKNWTKEKGYKIFLSCKDKIKKGCPNKRYKLKEIEDLVLAELKKLKIDPDYLDSVKSKTESAIDNNEADILRNQIKVNEDKISKLMDLYSLGTIDITTIKEKVDEINGEIDGLRSRIGVLEKNTDEVITTEEIVERLDKLEYFLDLEDIENTHAIISSLINRIEITPDETRIYWRF